MFDAFSNYIKKNNVMTAVNYIIDNGTIAPCNQGECYCVSFTNFEAVNTQGGVSVRNTDLINVNVFIVNRNMTFPATESNLTVAEGGLLFPFYNVRGENKVPYINVTFSMNLGRIPYIDYLQRGKVQSLYLIENDELVLAKMPLYADIKSVTPVMKLEYSKDTLVLLEKAASMAMNKFDHLDKFEPVKSGEYEKISDFFVNLKKRNHPAINLLFEDTTSTPLILTFLSDFSMAVNLDLPTYVTDELITAEAFDIAFWEYWIGNFKREHIKSTHEDVAYSTHKITYVSSHTVAPLKASTETCM